MSRMQKNKKANLGGLKTPLSLAANNAMPRTDRSVGGELLVHVSRVCKSIISILNHLILDHLSIPHHTKLKEYHIQQRPYIIWNTINH